MDIRARFALLLTVAIILPACGGDSTTGPSSAVVGVWTGTKTENGRTTPNIYFDFAANGTFKSCLFGPCTPNSVDTGTWLVNGTAVTITITETRQDSIANLPPIWPRNTVHEGTLSGDTMSGSARSLPGDIRPGRTYTWMLTRKR